MLIVGILKQYYAPLPSRNYVLYNFNSGLTAKSDSRIVMTVIGADEIYAYFPNHLKYYFAALKLNAHTKSLQLQYFK